MMKQLVQVAKLPQRQRYGLHWLNMDCPVNPEHKDSEGESQLLIRNRDILCKYQDEHVIGMREMLIYLSDGDEQRLDEILKHFNAPEDVRSYVFATEHRHEVGSDPLETLAALGAPADKPIRGVCIQCESLQLARQLAGQIPDKLPWCEDVPRTASGRLTTTLWHRGWTHARGKPARDQAQRKAGDGQAPERVEAVMGNSIFATDVSPSWAAITGATSEPEPATESEKLDLIIQKTKELAQKLEPSEEDPVVRHSQAEEIAQLIEQLRERTSRSTIERDPPQARRIVQNDPGMDEFYRLREEQEAQRKKLRNR